MNDIELLVTTFSSFLHVTLSRESFELKGLRTCHTGEGSYYGISWDKERNYYVLARDYPQYIKKNKIHVFDKNFVLQRTLFAGESLREAHQMVLVDDKLLVCNTNLNCITSISIDDDSVEHFYPLLAAKDRNFNHINSISYQDGRIWLTAANRFRNSFFMCFEYPSMRLLDADAVGLSVHNLVQWKDYRVTCDSFHGSLVWLRRCSIEPYEEYPMITMHLIPGANEVYLRHISMDRSFLREQRGTPVFPRGLAITENTAFVGLSELTKRSMRSDSISQLMVIDGLDKALMAEGAQPARMVELGAYGAVMEVRVISEMDYGHGVQ